MTARIIRRNAGRSQTKTGETVKNGCLGLTDSKGVRYVRFDDLSAFGQGGMQDDGDCPVDCSFDSLFFAEIVPAVAAQDIRPTSRKSIGINLRSADAHRCLEAIPGVKAENLE